MSVNACAAAVERGDPDRFLASMAAPPAMRAVMFPMFAFNLEIARAPWVTQEPMIAEMRLQWWRDVVTSALNGDAAPAHDVAAPLHHVIQTCDVDGALLEQMIDARRWDIARDPFEDWDDFDSYMDQTSGHLLWSVARAVGAPADVQAPLRDVAYAGGVANWLRAVPAIEGSGRMPLPDGRPGAVAKLAQRALDRMARAKGTRFGAATPVARSCWRAGATLRAALRDPGRVAEGALDGSEAARRWGIMWRAALRRW